VELELHKGESTSRVLYDQRIKELYSKNKRQVDTAIWIMSGGREFLHIVEVQDRKTKMGAPMVDLAAGKAEALGAHRVTLVAEQGFTDSALVRIKTQYPQLMDAVHLRAGLNSEWPEMWAFRQMVINIGENTGEHSIPVEMRHSRYIDAFTNAPKYEILYGVLRTATSAMVLCSVLDSDAISRGENGLVDFFGLGRGPGLRAGDNIRLTMNYVADGEARNATFSQALRRQQDPM
jgi:hypothetical protein